MKTVVVVTFEEELRGGNDNFGPKEILENSHTPPRQPPKEVEGTDFYWAIWSIHRLFAGARRFKNMHSRSVMKETSETNHLNANLFEGSVVSQKTWKTQLFGECNYLNWLHFVCMERKKNIDVGFLL